jgi:hypothetical protein
MELIEEGVSNILTIIAKEGTLIRCKRKRAIN